MSELRGVTCHMGSHSVTCYLTQLNNTTNTGNINLWCLDGRSSSLVSSRRSGLLTSSLDDLSLKGSKMYENGVHSMYSLQSIFEHSRFSYSNIHEDVKLATTTQRKEYCLRDHSFIYQVKKLSQPVHSTVAFSQPSCLHLEADGFTQMLVVGPYVWTRCRRGLPNRQTTRLHITPRIRDGVTMVNII